VVEVIVVMVISGVIWKDSGGFKEEEEVVGGDIAEDGDGEIAGVIAEVVARVEVAGRARRW